MMEFIGVDYDYPPVYFEKLPNSFQFDYLNEYDSFNLYHSAQSFMHFTVLEMMTTNACCTEQLLDDPQQDGNFLTIGKSDKTYGVVCQSMHYYMQLNNLFDIILSGELDLQDVSSMYSRIDDRITVIYSGYMHKGYRYKYEYKITDLDKFQLLLTKISIRYSKFF